MDVLAYDKQLCVDPMHCVLTRHVLFRTQTVGRQHVHTSQVIRNVLLFPVSLVDVELCLERVSHAQRQLVRCVLQCCRIQLKTWRDLCILCDHRCQRLNQCAPGKTQGIHHAAFDERLAFQDAA